MVYPPHSPHSPYGLIQEDLWPDEWLLSCILLNCTQRQQVEQVFPAFVARWSSAHAVSTADPAELRDVVTSLGFGNKRAVAIIRLSQDYLRPGWSDARRLHGIGVYAGRARDIFCRGVLGDTPPKDHALVEYWTFCHRLQDSTISSQYADVTHTSARERAYEDA